MVAEDDTLVVCLKALIKARETIYAFHGEPEKRGTNLTAGEHDR